RAGVAPGASPTPASTALSSQAYQGVEEELISRTVLSRSRVPKQSSLAGGEGAAHAARDRRFHTASCAPRGYRPRGVDRVPPVESLFEGDVADRVESATGNRGTPNDFRISSTVPRFWSRKAWRLSRSTLLRRATAIAIGYENGMPVAESVRIGFRTNGTGDFAAKYPAVGPQTIDRATFLSLTASMISSGRVISLKTVGKPTKFATIP